MHDCFVALWAEKWDYTNSSPVHLLDDESSGAKEVKYNFDITNDGLRKDIPLLVHADPRNTLLDHCKPFNQNEFMTELQAHFHPIHLNMWNNLLNDWWQPLSYIGYTFLKWMELCKKRKYCLLGRSHLKGTRIPHN